MAKSGHKSISRIEDPDNHTVGWYVRVHFNNGSRSKWFADHRHGGKRAALLKAIEFRDATEKELGKPRTDRTVCGGWKANPTGVVGVQRRVNSRGDYYVVTYAYEPGRLARKFFQIKSEKDAPGVLKRAAAYRRRKEQEIYGQTIKPNWSRALGVLSGASQ